MVMENVIVRITHNEVDQNRD